MRAEPEPDPRMRRELAKLLYDTLPIATIAGSVFALVIALLRWSQGNTSWLWPWLFAQLLAHAATFALILAYRRHGAASDPEPWLRRSSYAHGTVFALWGIGFAAFIDPNDPLTTALGIGMGSFTAAFMLAGVFAAPWAGALYSAILLVPIALRAALVGQPIYSWFAGLMLLNIALTAPRSRRLHEVFARSIELRLRNQDLAQRVGAEKRRVEQALQAKSRFLAAASHDLRQPLHALGLFVELLDEQVQGAKPRVFVDRIRSAAGAVSRLLESLLDLSRIDAQAVPIARCDFELDPLFQELAAEFEPEARAKGLALRVLPSNSCIHSDPLHLGRILRNLVSNAVRYTETGSVTLSARASAGALEVCVEDTGRGIPPEALEEVFEEFHQLPQPAGQRAGLGLGLSIVRGLAQLLGHRIELTSRIGAVSGTRASLQVPLAPPHARASSPGRCTPLPDALAGLHVLVVDDHAPVLEAMADLLAGWRCEPHCADSAAAALELVRQSGAPDLVICDYHLARGESGPAVLAELERAAGSPLAAVWVTGDTTRDSLQLLEETGRPHLFKPVQPSKLRSLLSALANE